MASAISEMNLYVLYFPEHATPSQMLYSSDKDLIKYLTLTNYYKKNI